MFGCFFKELKISTMACMKKKKKKTMGQAGNVSVNGIILPLQPGRFEEI